MKGMLLLALACAGPAAPLAGQRSGLEQAAARVRAAWQAHDAAGVVADGSGILLQLPGADPAAAVSPSQAAALLRDFLSGSSEVEVSVRAAREVERGVGYVELLRRFRMAGTQEIRSQRLLLGYRRDGGRWALSELRVVG